MSGNVFRMARWSPYVVGVGIGVLSWVTFAWMGKALGTSTTMVTAAGAIECLVSPSHVDANPYLVGVVGTSEKPRAIINWQSSLVIALFFGAWISAWLGRGPKSQRREKFVEHVPAIWAWRFGPSRTKRYIVAFFGGIVMIFGARLADGCTSGHAISGGLQLAVSSWMFLGAMFISGVAAAFLLFGKEGRKYVG